MRYKSARGRGSPAQQRTPSPLEAQPELEGVERGEGEEGAEQPTAPWCPDFLREVLETADLVGAITDYLGDDDLLAWALTCRGARQGQVVTGRRLRTGLRAVVASRERVEWAVSVGVNRGQVTYLAARAGELDILQWMVEKKYKVTARTMSGAAASGNLACLQWLRAQGSAWDESTFSAAAAGGHLHVAEWLVEVVPPCPWHWRTTMNAARAGQCDMLRFLLEQGCPCDWRTVEAAAEGGHVDCLECVVLEGGLPLDAEAAEGAARGGHLDTLQWLRQHGCPWDEDTCSKASEGGHLEVLRWAHEHGCPWDEECVTGAARGGHLGVLEWLLEQCAHTH